MRLNSLSWCMVLVILIVSSCVILCSMDYLSVLDAGYFLLLVSLFQFVMLIFVISNDLIITIINWDWLGLISYLLINFWASKTKSGIKAVVYNQVGDLSLWSLLFLIRHWVYIGSVDYPLRPFILWTFWMVITYLYCWINLSVSSFFFLFEFPYELACIKAYSSCLPLIYTISLMKVVESLISYNQFFNNWINNFYTADTKGCI